MKYNQWNILCEQKIVKAEHEALQQIMRKPRLPENELVVNQMIKNIPLKTKLNAILYALFWLTIIPALPSTIAACISFLYGCDMLTVIAWFGVVFIPLFFLYGVMGNVQKRLYVSYCLGFRGAKSALVLGWDGTEYAPFWGPTPDYFTQRYRLKMFRRH